MVLDAGVGLWGGVTCGSEVASCSRSFLMASPAGASLIDHFAALKDPRQWDCRKIGGVAASWLSSRLFSDQGWMRGLDVEVGEDRG